MRTLHTKRLAILTASLLCLAALPGMAQSKGRFDVVVVGGTPGGVMAAIAAAREGRSVALLERTAHIGGPPANGPGAAAIPTPGAIGGPFLEFPAPLPPPLPVNYPPPPPHPPPP